VRRRLTEIADQLRALATTGLHFTESPFDRERYEKLLALSAELMGLGDDVDPQKLEKLYRSTDEGYVTPKLDVRLAVFLDGRILLVRERVDGRWAMPGGFIDVGDSPSEAAMRETQEEAGVDTRVSRLAGVFDVRLQPEAPTHLFHIHKLLFTGELIDPSATPAAGNETTDAAFHDLDALPELSLGRTLHLHIREAHRVHADPNALPYFD
jgi:ADP-ribose pyrophosphatase YjhB (NUDIX family)